MRASVQSWQLDCRREMRWLFSLLEAKNFAVEGILFGGKCDSVTRRFSRENRKRVILWVTRIPKQCCAANWNFKPIARRTRLLSWWIGRPPKAKLHVCTCRKDEFEAIAWGKLVGSQFYFSNILSFDSPIRQPNALKHSLKSKKQALRLDIIHEMNE